MLTTHRLSALQTPQQSLLSGTTSSGLTRKCDRLDPAFILFRKLCSRCLGSMCCTHQFCSLPIDRKILCLTEMERRPALHDNPSVSCFCLSISYIRVLTARLLNFFARILLDLSSFLQELSQCSPSSCYDASSVHLGRNWPREFDLSHTWEAPLKPLF